MKKFISNSYILYTLGIILFLILWWILSLLLNVTSEIIPTPFITFQKTIELLGKPYTYVCLGYTFLRIILGFSISFVLALFLGVLAGNLPIFKEIIKPTIVIIKSIPTAAIVFVFIILLSPKDAPILVTSLVSFPILFESIASGVSNVDEGILLASKVDGANKIKENLSIRIPLALPYIGVGILSSFSLSFKIEIMAEIITGYTKNGLGSLIKASQNNDPTDMNSVFAYCLIAVILVLLISLLSRIIKNKLKAIA